MNLLDSISTWSVLKWVILVLVAGFIGQFGRMLAEMIAVKIRLRRTKKSVLSETDTNFSKIKSSSLAGEADKETLPRAADTAGPDDKKALKILAKARKKELKAKNK